MQSYAFGKDVSNSVTLDGAKVSFTLAFAASYRNSGASKAMPAFDVIDYGQEDYVFGSAEKDARHWNKDLLEIFEEHADTLSPLFNKAEQGRLPTWAVALISVGSAAAAVCIAVTVVIFVRKQRNKNGIA